MSPQRVFKLVLLIPSARRKVHGEIDKATSELEAKVPHLASLATPQILTLPLQLAPHHPTAPALTSIPLTGLSRTDVAAALSTLATLPNTKWESGRVSGAVYHGGSELGEVWKDAFGQFVVSNPLHADVFPGPSLPGSLVPASPADARITQV